MLGFTGALSHQFGELAQHWEEAGIGRGERGCWRYLGKELSRAHWLGGPGLAACLGDWCLERGWPSPLTHLASPPHTQRCHSDPHLDAHISTHFLNCNTSALPILSPSSIFPSHLSNITRQFIYYNIYCLLLSPHWNASSTRAGWLACFAH